MDIEFHYYISFILARKAGFTLEESEIMAYSNQHVDDNTEHRYVNYRDGGYYISQISQTMDISKPSQKRQTIYPLFHFIPASPDEVHEERAIPPFEHQFNTAPNSTNAQELLKLAMESGDLYRIGIASHAYADSWSHQNFVGLKHRFNRNPSGFAWIIPNICHADFLHAPDTVGTIWDDKRLRKREINNNERFLEAAEYIFRFYGQYKEMDAQQVEQEWVALKGPLSIAMERETFDDEPPPPFPTGDRQSKGRRSAYLEICPEIPRYDKKKWWIEAIDEMEHETDVFDRYWAKDDFTSSHWFKFQEAASIHRNTALNILSDLYKEYNLPTNYSA